MSTELLDQAIALSKEGKKLEARELLVQIIKDDVHNEAAWMWYADALPTHADRVKALEECLYHNPDCQAAQKGLAALKESEAPPE